MLQYIYFILILAIGLIFFNTNSYIIRYIALSSTGLILVLSSIILLGFDKNNFYFQYYSSYKLSLEFFNIYLSFGLDGVSLFFFLLSNFLVFLCILFLDKEPFYKLYIINLLIIDLFLLFVFSVLDILFFYIFFEAILIPMVLIIGIWGSRERKIRAVYLFFFYTFIGSIFMLLSLLYIYTTVGSLNIEYLYNYSFTFNEQYWLWLAFFLSFSAKMPLFPFHIWLPEAHVEAPAIGSVLLAGILLKLGVYGFLRFSLILFPEASQYFAPLIYVFGLLGIILSSLIAVRQNDTKRIIAYSSVAHMNLITIGIFSLTLIGIEGAILQSLSHGFVAGGLFFLIGMLYNRYHSRELYHYSGLVYTMPVFSVFFLIFNLANIALPGSSSFIGEFLLLAGIAKVSYITFILATTGVILCGIYSLWTYNRIFFGNINYITMKYSKDLSFKEISILFPLCFLILFMGLNPTFFVEYIHTTSLYLTLINNLF